MHLWTILVLGTLRLCLNADYDRIHDLSNNHRTIRQMLGHGIFDFEKCYSLQSIKDNVSLLSVEILNEINEVVVKTGHEHISPHGVNLKGRCDSFVVETNVHFPTDINLLWDAMRKSIDITSQFCKKLDVPDWDVKPKHLEIKRLFRKCQIVRRSKSKKKLTTEKRKDKFKEAHTNYINCANSYILSIEMTMQILQEKGLNDLDFEKLNIFLEHSKRQIDQIQRRTINDEVISHNEKVFSVFEEHTEWIKKGKAGVPQELGLRVCVVEDQFGFILHHNVMKKTTDDKIAVPIVCETKDKFNSLNQMSFDKGFHSPNNQIELKTHLERVILPKKGHMTKEAAPWQTSEYFIEARHQHSAVESAINALEVHGLNRCPDRGLEGFERYVALAVLGRNLHQLGAIIIKKERKARKENAA